jgi:beta-galactosidase/beta-glucuronidase
VDSLHVHHAETKAGDEGDGDSAGLQEWPDDPTPRDLCLGGTAFKHWSKLFNVYEGILNHRQVAVFDFRKQAGKSSWSRTIVAVKTKEDVFEGKSFGLETRQVGDWQLCYSPVGFLCQGKLMDVSEIEELLSGISRYKAA